MARVIINPGPANSNLERILGEEQNAFERFEREEEERNKEFDKNEEYRQKRAEEQLSSIAKDYSTAEAEREKVSQETIESLNELEDRVSTAESLRQSTFETNETNRSNTFATNQVERESAFNIKQAERDNTFAEQISVQNTTFSDKEIERTVAFNTQMNSQAQTFAANEAQRDVKVDEKVESITELQESVKELSILVDGGDVEIPITESLGYYYTGSVGDTWDSSKKKQNEGSPYAEIDLSSYAGKTIKIKWDNHDLQSSRKIVLVNGENKIVKSIAEADYTLPLAWDVPKNAMLYESHKYTSSVSFSYSVNGIVERVSSVEELSSEIDERVSDIESKLNGGNIPIQIVESNGYYYGGVPGGPVVTYENGSSKYGHIDLSDKEGMDVLVSIEGQIEGSGRYILLTVEGIIIDRISEGEMAEPKTWTIPSNCVLYYSHKATTTIEIAVSSKSIEDRIVSIENEVSNIKENTVYISNEGSDTNEGSESSPFKTFSRAISSGRKNIVVNAGTYEAEKLSVSNRECVNIYVKDVATTDITKHKPKAVIDNSVNVDVTEDSTTGLLIGNVSMGENTNWYKVFVSKVLPIVPTGLQSETYNAILWQHYEGNDLLDIKLKPVLTINECEQQSGTFFYSHTEGRVYINKSVIDTTISPVFKRLKHETGTIIHVIRVNGFYMEDVSIKYAPTWGLMLQNTNGKVKECVFSHTAYRNGYEMIASNADVLGCESYKNAGDGFGIASHGQGNFFDCRGHHNYDDGVSHHDGSTGLVCGGMYHNNGKAGVASPYSGSRVDVQNAMLVDNRYGIYAGTGTDDCYVCGCLFKGNNTGVLNVGYSLHLYNNVFKDNANKITGNGNTIEY